MPNDFAEYLSFGAMSRAHDRLRQARLAAGYNTAADAANRFGWSRHTYISHEGGKRPAGLCMNAELYARAYRVDPEWLLYGRGRGPGGMPSEPENITVPDQRILQLAVSYVLSQPGQLGSDEHARIIVAIYRALAAADQMGETVNERTAGTILMREWSRLSDRAHQHDKRCDPAADSRGKTDGKRVRHHRNTQQGALRLLNDRIQHQRGR